MKPVQQTAMVYERDLKTLRGARERLTKNKSWPQKELEKCVAALGLAIHFYAKNSPGVQEMLETIEADMGGQRARRRSANGSKR